MNSRSECKRCGGTGWIGRTSSTHNPRTPCDCNPANWDELFSSNFDAWLGTVLESRDSASNPRNRPER